MPNCLNGQFTARIWYIWIKIPELKLTWKLARKRHYVQTCRRPFKNSSSSSRRYIFANSIEMLIFPFERRTSPCTCSRPFFDVLLGFARGALGGCKRYFLLCYWLRMFLAGAFKFGTRAVYELAEIHFLLENSTMFC